MDGSLFTFPIKWLGIFVQDRPGLRGSEREGEPVEYSTREKGRGKGESGAMERHKSDAGRGEGKDVRDGFRGYERASKRGEREA